MTRRFSHLQNEADKIRIEPPRSAWMRLEAQLGAHAADKKMHRVRKLSIAASVLAIIAFGFVGYYFMNVHGTYTSEIYSQKLEPLVNDPPSGTSIYDINKVKSLTETWSQ